MNRRGTTLLELIVVIAILAPLTIHVLKSLVQARNTRTDSATTLAAMQSVREELDSVRLHIATTGSRPPDQTTQSVTLRNNHSAILTTTVREDSATRLLRISVEATFPEAVAGLKPVFLETLAPKPTAAGMSTP